MPVGADTSAGSDAPESTSAPPPGGGGSISSGYDRGLGLGLGLGRSSDIARGCWGGPNDAPRLLRRTLVVGGFGSVRTERVERVGGRILTEFLLDYIGPEWVSQCCRVRLCGSRKRMKARYQLPRTALCIWLPTLSHALTQCIPQRRESRITKT
ncbi:hypothetical protein BC826DRAFT_831 [Russula brevipes]|nr:hypothetical protein BC826DRAFT_831 [Russula brevipes]